MKTLVAAATTPSAISRGQRVIVGALLIIFLAELALSLNWRMEHDTPLLHYVAFLIDQHDFVPYKDVFETSMPGTFLFHLAIGKTLGYGDTAFRVVDIAYLMLLLTATWFLVRPIMGPLPALISPLLFLAYSISTRVQR